jgi:hypothetical protein
MGPYCNFCERRCFVPIPEGTPPEIRKAYGTSAIIATCAGGQKFEQETVGWSYDLIRRAIANPVGKPSP